MGERIKIVPLGEVDGGLIMRGCNSGQYDIRNNRNS